MRSVLFSNPFEIRLNTGEDCARFTLATMSYKPFHRIGIAFVIIASVFTVLQRMAQRDNVRRNCTGIVRARIGKRYPVISRQRMPQTRRTTTHRTTMIEVIKRPLPLGIRESIGQFSLTRVALMVVDQFLVWILLTPEMYAVKHLCPKRSIVYVFVLLLGKHALTICGISGLALCAYIFALINTLLPFFVANFLLVSGVVCCAFILATFFASFMQTINATAVLVERTEWQFAAAMRTAFHAVISLLALLEKCGKAVRLAVQTVHEAVLSHLSIIPQGMA